MDDLSALQWMTDRELVMFIERLPLVQRQILKLRFTGDMTHAEIASILGRSSADVRMHLSRALRFLRTRLSALGHAPEPRRRSRMRRAGREATVLRARRWALHTRGPGTFSAR